jgi:methylenetetrahydrofolate reductase (NADPH)
VAGTHALAAAMLRRASVELTWHDAGRIGACRSHLEPRTQAFVSFVPGQTWAQTIDACIAVRRAGFEPVPHIPVRELANAAAFENLAVQLRQRPAVHKVLLIAGDRAVPAGPYASSLEALRSGILSHNGIVDVAVAGHPESHPRISDAELVSAEREKAACAKAEAIRLSFVTQFFFDADPFIAWARRLRNDGIDVPIVAGIAGPASVATLVKYALRCGVGASMRAIAANPQSIAGVALQRSPERIVQAVAAASLEPGMQPMGLHFYSFGGLARTCEWIARERENPAAL